MVEDLSEDALIEVILPTTVTSIGWGAFLECKSLQFIKILAISPPTMVAEAFDHTNECPIYVPAGSVDAYKSATNWTRYASRIQAIVN